VITTKKEQESDLKLLSCSFSIQKISEGDTMTKNKKIELLINDNKKLIEENKKLHELNSEELSSKISSGIDRYTDVIEKLNKKYIELDRLRIAGIKNRWKYHRMLLDLKVRKVFGV